MIGNGSTFLARSDQAFFNPVNLAVLKIFPFPLNLKLLYLISLTTAGIGTFLFLRSRKDTSSNALVGTCIFIFSGLFLSQIYNLAFFQSISFVPWVFLFCRKKIILTSFVLALQILSGPIEIALTTSLLALVYCRSLKFLLSFIFAFLLAGVKIIPFFDLNSLTSGNLKYFFRISPQIAEIKYFYPGLAVLFSLIFVRKNFLFLGLFLFCLLMAFPANSPLYIFYLLPPFYWIEQPSVFLPFAGFFLATLASANWRKILTPLLFLELIIFNYFNLPRIKTATIIRNLETQYPVIKKIQKEKAKIWFNDNKPSKEIQPLEPNNNLLWGIPSLNSFDLGTKRHQLYLSLIDKDNLSLLRFQSIKYQINPEKEITDPLPPVYEPKTVRLVKTQQELISSLTDKRFNPENESLVEEKINKNGVRVIAQSFSKGFTNTIPVNLNQQGTTGNEEPIFSLPSLKVGIFVSFFSFILLILLGFLRRRSIFLRIFF